jgi:hypothetical protein
MEIRDIFQSSSVLLKPVHIGGFCKVRHNDDVNLPASSSRSAHKEKLARLGRHIILRSQ